MSEISEPPYRNFGEKLRQLRESKSESLDDVSGAVEIDAQELVAFEMGQNRPDQDILLLMFNHFNLGEILANELWKLAGYDGTPDMICINPEHDHTKSLDVEAEDMAQTIQRTLMIMVDPRIMYSDGIEAVAGDRGVVLNFSQTNGPGGKPLTVSRIGMSREQAQMLMGVLHQVLYDLDNKQPPRQLDSGS